MNMHAVDDHAVPGGLTFERSRDRAGITAAQPRHGVEQMGKARKPLRHGGACVLVARRRMAETNQHASLSKSPDETRRGLFGCKRHDCYRAARRGEEGEIVVTPHADVAQRVHAWPLRREEQSFEMNAENRG